MTIRRNRSITLRQLAAATLGVLLALLWVLAGAGGATAQDLESQLDEKRGQLEQVEEQEGVLTSEIDQFDAEIEQLAGEVAVLRNREAIVQQELDATIARLAEAKDRLGVLRERLQDSLGVLRQRLVAIYKSDDPDALTVILDADGFDEMVERYEYLRSIEDQDSAIVSRVRGLRDGTRITVDEITAAKEEIEARKAELERTRMQLEAREADLSVARDRKAGALSEVQGHIAELEGEIADVEADIQAQLQAAQEAEEAAAPPPTAGPVPGETSTGPTSSSGFIWPVDGPVVSPFGMRWGRMHEGVDIAVPAGTPIRAAASGSVVLAAPTGGYGNYTCISHGGGLSTCYAHQSSYAVGAGQGVEQGQTIGYVGCTGSCFGDHLHFEVRVNGAAVDPMGYL